MGQGEEWTWWQVLMLIGVTAASGIFAIVISEYLQSRATSQGKKHKAKMKKARKDRRL